MQFSWLRSFVTTLAVVAALWLPAAAAAQDGFPEDVGGAIRTYEDEWPIQDWPDGPVQYLMLNYEIDIWKKLSSDGERREFIAWFWNRRDPDPRDEESPLRTEFYTRVAYANQRFNGFPRGWRSDRGRVFVTLGPPTGGMRRVDGGGGRCQGYQGELWSFRTMNMAFSASMGEFFVLFIETRTNTYEVCDPVMLGPGAFPIELSRALEITQEAWVLDDVTEFEPGRGAVVGEIPATDVVGSTKPLTVPEWASPGAAGTIVVPVELPLRALFFEPLEDRLVVSLRVDATLTPVGQGTAWQGSDNWRLELDGAAAGSIGTSLLRTAVVLPAEPGGWAVSLTVVDALSAVAYRWEGAVEVTADGAVISPPLVARQLERLREGGEVAVVAPQQPVFSPGEEMAIVSWVRGRLPTPDDVGLRLVDSNGTEVALVSSPAAWGDAAAAGPLVVQATVPEVAPGNYYLSIVVGDLASAPTVVRIQ